MNGQRHEPVLSDDDVVAILQSQEADKELATRYGVQSRTIARVRLQTSFRVLRIAKTLGIQRESTSFWTDERVAELRRLHGLGLSDRQIQAAMKAPTKNVILGKRNRLGLRHNPEVGRLNAKVNTPKPKPQCRPAAPAKPVLVATAAEAPLPPAGSIPDDSVAFINLTWRQCAWAYDDPGQGRMWAMRCCGRPAPQGSRFCPSHMLVMESEASKKAKKGRAYERSLRRYAA